MKTIIRMSVLVFAVLFLNIICTVPSHASDTDDFDAEYYANAYPDVRAVIGSKPIDLYCHYLNFGMNEGRFKNAAEEATGVASCSIDTYVDVDIANQTMTYYKDGEVVLSSSCVTGNPNTGNSTPKGSFVLRTKIPGKYLVGPTWNVWVDRWMKFTGNVGLHDAGWRSKFGGNIYKSDGSHGCVNLPTETAYELYDMIDVGTAVIVH